MSFTLLFTRLWGVIVLAVVAAGPLEAVAVDRPGPLPVEIWNVIHAAVSEEREIPYFVSRALNVGRFSTQTLRGGWAYLTSLSDGHSFDYRLQVSTRFLGASVADPSLVSDALMFYTDLQMPYPLAIRRSLERIERFDLTWQERQVGWRYLAAHGAAWAPSHTTSQGAYDRVFWSALRELGDPYRREVGLLVFRTLLNSPPNFNFPEALEARLLQLRTELEDIATLRVLVLLRTRMHRLPDLRRILNEDFQSPSAEVRSLALETAIAVLREDRLHPGVVAIEDISALRHRLHLALSENRLALPFGVLAIMLDIMGDEELGDYYARMWQHADSRIFFQIFDGSAELPSAMFRRIRGMTADEKRAFVRATVVHERSDRGTLNFPRIFRIFEPSSSSWMELVDALGGRQSAARLSIEEARALIAAVGKIAMPAIESTEGLEHVRALASLVSLNSRMAAEMFALPDFSLVEAVALLAYPGLITRASSRAWERVVTRASLEDFKDFFWKAQGFSDHVWWRMAADRAHTMGWLAPGGRDLRHFQEFGGGVERLASTLPLAERLFVSDPQRQRDALRTIPDSAEWRRNDFELRAAVRAYRMQPGLSAELGERVAPLSLSIAQSVSRAWEPQERFEGILGLIRSEVPEDWLAAAELMISNSASLPLAPWLASELLRMRDRSFERLQFGSAHRSAAAYWMPRLRLLAQHRTGTNLDISFARAYSGAQAREDIRWLMRAEVYTESSYWIMVHAMGNFPDDLELQQLARRYQMAFIRNNHSVCSRYWIFRGLRSGS